MPTAIAVAPAVPVWIYRKGVVVDGGVCSGVADFKSFVPELLGSLVGRSTSSSASLSAVVVGVHLQCNINSCAVFRFEVDLIGGTITIHSPTAAAASSLVYPLFSSVVS